MPRALNLLRSSIGRRPSFDKGLKAAGFDLVDKVSDPKPDDVVLTWNRQTGHHETAQRFESSGSRVVVAENGYFGKDWMGAEWFALALWHNAGAGDWKPEGPERWDMFHVELKPWRFGSETIILGQRCIGEPGVRSPELWAETTKARIGGRIRRHPGKDKAKPLEDDLRNARCVVTWNSGAALKAVLLGVPVFYEFEEWIGAEAGLPMSMWGHEPKRDDAARLAMLRRLAWAQWTAEEIESGFPFKRLLEPA